MRELESVSERITYIYSDNLGFGSGHNIAIDRAIDLGSDYHIIINPDIYWNWRYNRAVGAIYGSE